MFQEAIWRVGVLEVRCWWVCRLWGSVGDVVVDIGGREMGIVLEVWVQGGWEVG